MENKIAVINHSMTMTTMEISVFTFLCYPGTLLYLYILVFIICI